VADLRPLAIRKAEKRKEALRRERNQIKKLNRVIIEADVNDYLDDDLDEYLDTDSDEHDVYKPTAEEIEKITSLFRTMREKYIGNNEVITREYSRWLLGYFKEHDRARYDRIQKYEKNRRLRLLEE